jgi:hypothetical protein
VVDKRVVIPVLKSGSKHKRKQKIKIGGIPLIQHQHGFLLPIVVLKYAYLLLGGNYCHLCFVFPNKNLDFYLLAQPKFVKTQRNRRKELKIIEGRSNSAAFFGAILFLTFLTFHF